MRLLVAKDTITAFTKNPIKDTNNNRNTLFNWKFSITRHIKINADGSSVDHGWVSFGGVAKDDQGKWLEGFYGRIGQRLSFESRIVGHTQMPLTCERKRLVQSYHRDGFSNCLRVDRNCRYGQPPGSYHRLRL